MSKKKKIIRRSIKNRNGSLEQLNTPDKLIEEAMVAADNIILSGNYNIKIVEDEDRTARVFVLRDIKTKDIIVTLTPDKDSGFAFVSSYRNIEISGYVNMRLENITNFEDLVVSLEEFIFGEQVLNAFGVQEFISTDYSKSDKDSVALQRIFIEDLMIVSGVILNIRESYFKIR